MTKHIKTDKQLNLFDLPEFFGNCILPRKKENSHNNTATSSKENSTSESYDSLQISHTSLLPRKDDTPPKKISTSVVTDTSYSHELLFKRLSNSHFRNSFHLKLKDIQYIQSKGINTIRSHAADFIAHRLAPSKIPNDGRQTPMHGHPVFVAQHATACCCRGCFEKWHHIPAGRELTSEEQAYAISVLMEWITREYELYLKNHPL